MIGYVEMVLVPVAGKGLTRQPQPHGAKLMDRSA